MNVKAIEAMILLEGQGCFLTNIRPQFRAFDACPRLIGKQPLRQ